LTLCPSEQVCVSFLSQSFSTQIKWFPDHEFDFCDSDMFQRITAFGITLPSMLGTCLEVYCKWEVLPKGLLSVSFCFLWEQVASGGIYLCNILGWSSFSSICPVVHPIIHPSLHPSKAKRGRVRALLKLQNSTVSGNCPFCPIYRAIGIHPVMKGYWPIIKISGRQ
jgi:hypothetical protein